MGTMSHYGHQIKKRRRIKKGKQIIEGIKIPKNMKITSSYEKAIKNADIIFLMTSAKHIASVCQNIKPYYNKNKYFVLVVRVLNKEHLNLFMKSLKII